MYSRKSQANFPKYTLMELSFAVRLQKRIFTLKFKIYIATILIFIMNGCATVQHGHYAVISQVEITDDEYVLIDKNGYG